MLALGLDGGRVTLMDEATGEVKWSLEEAHSETHSGDTRVAMSPGGRFVARVGFNDARWTLLNVLSGAVHRVGATHDGTGACSCEVPDLGDRLVQEGCPVVAHTAGIRSVVFSPCGRFATGGLDGAVIVWDAQTGEAEHRLVGLYSTEITSLTFSASGARLASGSVDGCIHVWESRKGELLRTIPECHKLLLGVHFSPTDSRMLASAGGDWKIHLWDIQSGEKIRSMQGHGFAVFSPDGRTIATASLITNYVHLLDAETGTLRFSIAAHKVAFCAAFSVDGSKLATGGDDDTCKVWDSSTGAPLRTIELGTWMFSVAWERDWVRDTQRGEAFAMGQHPRLGGGSQVLELEVGVVRMILDRV